VYRFPAFHDLGFDLWMWDGLKSTFQLMEEAMVLCHVG
jgi:hypothetical protein